MALSAAHFRPARHPAEEAAAADEADANQGAARADYRKDLDFYSAVKEQKVDQNFHPKTAASAKKQKAETETGSASPEARGSGTRAGLVSLQVAALKSSGEADRLAKTLRTKGYPVFIVNPAQGRSE